MKALIGENNKFKKKTLIILLIAIIIIAYNSVIFAASSSKDEIVDKYLKPNTVVEENTNFKKSDGAMIIIAIITEIIAFGILFFVSWLINKSIGKKDDIHKTAFILWIIVFTINLFTIITNKPFAIGYNVTSRTDVRKNGYYMSLGYAVRIEDDETSFEWLHDFIIERIK